jgi:Fe-S cluster biogenesis protein NfuA
VPRKKAVNKRKFALFASVVTDKSVPEGHKGLHGFLYGEEGAEAHDDTEEENLAREEEEDQGGVRVAVSRYVQRKAAQKKAGVYAIYNSRGEPQYIGFARSILAAVKGHLAAAGEEACSAVETRLLPPGAVANRSRLQAEADAWLQELGEVPPGNSGDGGVWQGKLGVVDVETFEEKKLKLQKAMGEKLSDAAALDETSQQRRDNIMKAVSGDDWSSVIDEQTQETVVPPAKEQAPATPIVSPFTTSAVQETAGPASGEDLEMSIESVDKVLDEVRPILIADGGNVEVVSVDDGVVRLRLQGACGTCASSSGTMKMGIERSLKNAFGDKLKEVTQVDAIDTSASVSSVNSHLDMLRPAIKSFGGSVEVLKIADGACQIKYEGPPTIANGVVAAIKAQFPDIVDVVLQE